MDELSDKDPNIISEPKTQSYGLFEPEQLNVNGMNILKIILLCLKKCFQIQKIL